MRSHESRFSVPYNSHEDEDTPLLSDIDQWHENVSLDESYVPAKTNEEPTLTGINNDVYGVICSQLNFQELGRLASISKESNRKTNKMPVNNEFKIYGRMTEAFNEIKPLERAEKIQEFATSPTVSLAGVALTIVTGGLTHPLLVFLSEQLDSFIKKLEQAKDEADTQLNKFGGMNDTYKKIKQARYLNSSFFHKAAEFNRQQPTFFTFNNFQTACSLLANDFLVVVTAFLPILGLFGQMPQQLLFGNFVNNWQNQIEQFNEQTDKLIEENKDLVSAFKNCKR